MEARYVEAENDLPCTCPDTYLVGPGGSELFSTVGPKSGSVGPSSSLRGTQIGFGGTRWDRWVPALLYMGPYTPFGFYNASQGEGRPHDNHFHCPLALSSRCASSRCVQSFKGEPGTTNVDR